MIKIKQEYDEGIRGDWYYGMAYFDYERRKAVTYIIPLNWIVWIGRQIWFHLRLPPRDWTSGFYDIAYKAGYDRGYDIGWDDALRPWKQELENIQKEFKDFGNL